MSAYKVAMIATASSPSIAPITHRARSHQHHHTTTVTTAVTTATATPDVLPLGRIHIGSTQNAHGTWNC